MDPAVRLIVRREIRCRQIFRMPTHAPHWDVSYVPLLFSALRRFADVVRRSAVFIRTFGEGFPPQNLQFAPPPIAAKLCALYLFFGRDRELQICITGTFLQWTINTGSYSSLSNRKGANLCRKCTGIRLAAGLRPGERISSPIPLAWGSLELGQLSLASLRDRLIEYQASAGVRAGMSPLPGGR